MLKNKLYQYGDENGLVPAHLHFGKEVYNNMVRNKHLIAAINAETDERMTYEELAQKTAGVTLSLTRIGVRKGDVVSVCSEKRLEVLPTILGVICSGAVYSPMDLTYGAMPLLHRLKIGRPKVMFCSGAAYVTHRSTFESVGSIERYVLYDNVDQDGVHLFHHFLVHDVRVEEFEPTPVDGWSDNVFILYSSGTTGLPKGIPLTHLGFSLNSQCVVPDSYHGLSVLNTREWYYTYGLMYTLSCLRAGATVVYYTSPQQEVMLQAVQDYKTEVMQVAPSTVTELIKSTILENYDLSSPKYLISCSTPIGKKEVDAIKKRIPSLKDVLQVYGMSEAGSVAHEMFAPLGSRAGSCGLPCSGFVIKIVDLTTRKALGANQRGEVCIKGPSVVKAYLNNVNPECKDSEGFLLTGDVGYYDNDGYLYIVDRIKELIKFNDVSIPPAEFEAILQQHGAVREAGVIGMPHPKHGEAPVAFVALQPGLTATEDELVEYLHSRVTFRMRLAGGVRFVDKLPRGAGDKLDRKELKRMLNTIS